MFAGSKQGSHRVLTLIVALAAVALAVALVVLPSNRADALVAGSLTPTISSDQADYPPGATVTLTGSNWQPGETVNIVVDDDGVDERDWQRDVTVTADENGNIRDQFQLPNWFVANYSVKATGAQSGVATTTFTDAVAKIEGKDSGGVNYRSTGGPLDGWDELEKIPMRLVFTNTGSQTVLVSFDHTSNSGRRIPGIKDLVDWTAANSKVTSLNAQLTDTSGQEWAYTVTANLASGTNNSNPGYVEFKAILAAGSHDYPGGSLHVNLSGDGTGTMQINPSDVIAANPDLVVDKTGPATAAPGSTIEYKIYYKNISTTDAATGVAIEDVLPSDANGNPLITFDSCSDSCTVAGNEVTWIIGNLAPGAGTDPNNELFRTLRVKIPQNATNGTNYVNNTDILSADAEQDLSNCGAVDSDNNADNDNAACDNYDSLKTTVASNSAPNAVNDSLTTNEDTQNSVNVLSNDTDPDGDTLSVTSHTNASHGSLSRSGGTFTYTPDANYNGPDSFTYTVSDGKGGTATATVNITVNAVNDKPVAKDLTGQDDQVTTPEDTPKGITLQASDVDSSNLSFSIVTGPSHGSLSGSGENQTYTPNANYNGPDTFTFEVCDDSTPDPLCDEGTVDIVVTPVNDKPVAQNDSRSVDEDQTLNVAAPGVLSNDTDIDGSSLTAVLVDGPTHGTLNLNADGSFSYSPAADYNGPDSFTYKANDGTDDSNAATVSITVNPVNDPPVNSVPGAQNINEDQSKVFSAANGNQISISDSDADSDDVKVTLSADNGKLSLGGIAGLIFSSGDGTNDTAMSFTGSIPAINTALNLLTFTPDANYDGTGAKLTIETNDLGHNGSGGEKSDTDSVVFNITPQNDPPVIPENGVTNDGPVDEGSPATITVTATDPDTPAADLRYSFDCNGDGDYDDPSDKGPQAANDAQCTYFDNGTYLVNVKVTDGAGGSDLGSTNVLVRNVAPSADFDATPATIDEGQSVNLSLTNVVDPGTADTHEYRFKCGDAAWAAFGASNTASCQATDDGNLVVKGQVRDDDGGLSPEYDRTITVNNVPPHVDPPEGGPNGENQSSNEGQNKAFEVGSFTDPGADGPWSVTVDWGDGSSADIFNAANPGDLGQQQHAYDDNGDYTVTVTVAENGANAPSGQASFHITVNNVSPTGVLGNNGPVNEGDNATISFTGQTEPSNADNNAGLRYAYNCDGSVFGTIPTYASLAGSGASNQCSFADNGNHTVRALIMDKDGGYNVYTTSVEVSNVAPRVTLLSGPDLVKESTTIERIYTFNATDAGDDELTITVDCGANGDLVDTNGATPGGTYEYNPATGDGSFKCIFPDGGPDGLTKSNVTVRATDDDGISDSDNQIVIVTVENDNPQATFNAPTSVNEGDSINLSLTDATDPAGSNDTLEYRFDCGNGFGAWGGSTASCPTTDDGNVIVKGQVRDEDGGLSEIYQKTVTVNNLPPRVVLDGPATADESQTAEHTYTFTVTDAGTADTFTVEGDPSCGANGQLVSGSLQTTASGGSFKCIFPDGDSTTNVEIQVRDDDGALDADSQRVVIVNVANVAPVLTIAADQSSNEGQNKPFVLGSFTDPGDDSPWSVTVDWGDGSDDTTFNSASPGNLPDKLHTYADDGTYTVRVTVAEAGGSPSDSETFTVTVANVVPTANDDQMTTTELKAVTGNLLDNDSDPGNDLDRASLEILDLNALSQTAPGPLGGVVTISNLLDGNVTYTPNRGFVDIDNFRYKVCDDDGDCSQANVEVTVDPINCNEDIDVIKDATGADNVIKGTQGADILRGTSGYDVICALGGNDRIYAGLGDDLLIGDTGQDRMWSEGGNDVMRGGGQTDAMDSGLGDDYVTGDTGRDVIMARGGIDFIELRDASAGDAADGGAGRDQCKKDAGDKTVSCELQ